MLRCSILPCAQRILHAAFPQHDGNRREWLHEMLDAAVGFGDDNVQIAARRGRIEIANFKAAGRHVGLINRVAVLLHGDRGVGAGDPSNDRSEAAHALRQHGVIRKNLRTAKHHTVKHVARGTGFPHLELPPQKLDVAAQGRIQRRKRLFPVVLGHGAVVAQAPRPRVNTALQVGIKLILRLTVPAPAARPVDAVIDQQRRNALVPARRINGAARARVERRLRDRDVQPLPVKIQPGGSVRYECAGVGNNRLDRKHG